ncbi:MAG: ParB/RepB/Spo0J family partition protein [Planctomycetia bacterium]|nr:ParB/RepB/Spo0J family partition protein [Planctomycetia bacterium]
MKKTSQKRATSTRRQRIDGAHKTATPTGASTGLRDRIKELRRVRASALQPHPLNWRTHPPEQREALEAVLREIGFASALIARELPDGQLQLIDGHLRAETSPDAEVPVLVLDVDEAEAEQLLATLDPLAAMAKSDAQSVATLHERVRTNEAAVARLLDDIRLQAEAVQRNLARSTADKDATPLRLEHLYQVMVECQDETAQRDLFEHLTQQGYQCRALGSVDD